MEMLEDGVTHLHPSVKELILSFSKEENSFVFFFNAEKMPTVFLAVGETHK